VRTGAAKPTDFSKVIVDTTVQPKAVAFPTDARLMHRVPRAAGEAGQEDRRRASPVLRAGGQTCADRSSALCPRQAVQARQQGAQTIRTYLGRVIRDIGRKIRDEAELESAFAHPLMLARRVREQRQHQRWTQGLFPARPPRSNASAKARRIALMSFGVKVSLAATLHRSQGGQFIAHVKAFARQPLRRSHARRRDPGDRDPGRRQPRPHRRRPRLSRPQTPQPEHKFKVYISGQRRRVTKTIKRELRRRPRGLNRSSDTSRPSIAWAETTSPELMADAANAVLAAAGYNFSAACSNGWLSCCP